MSAVNFAEEMAVAVPERAATTTHPTRPFLWSVRRELWESLSIVGGPIVVACIIVLATLVAAVRLTGDMLAQLQHNQAPLSSLASLPLLVIPFFLGITMVGVAFFYSLDALHSERADRSILFWKSLPVSDSVTVLSKIAIPMLLLPVITFVTALAAQIVVFLIENAVLLAHHISIGILWSGREWPQIIGLTAYSLIVVTLWYAPIYAWCLVVSSWARRAALIWAILPFFALAVFEKIALHSRYVVDFLRYRFDGVFQVAYANKLVPQGDNGGFSFDYSPLHFLATPGLYGGLLFAAAVLILTIRMRRFNTPL
jgi:ABC-2 type transport system permease protein